MSEKFNKVMALAMSTNSESEAISCFLKAKSMCGSKWSPEKEVETYKGRSAIHWYQLALSNNVTSTFWMGRARSLGEDLKAAKTLLIDAKTLLIHAKEKENKRSYAVIILFMVAMVAFVTANVILG
jgi:hypothetical protein